MIPGQNVICEFAFNNFPLLNNNGPEIDEELTIDQVKQVDDNIFLRFQKYDRQNMKLFFNSIYFE